MTVLPRFFSDPLSGGTFAFGETLTSTEMNTILGGVRKIDEAIERQICFNWPPGYESTTAADTGCACWSPGHSIWVEGRQTEASATGPAAMMGRQTNYFTSAGSITGLAGLIVKDIVGFGNYVVMCGAPDVASDQKYRSTIDLSTWASGTSGLSSTAGINTICHHYVASPAVSLFVSGADGGTVETSPTGVTWTQRTAANANDIVAMRSNGVVIVGVSSATTINCVTSTDGTTWVQRTMATTAAWVDVCWLANQSKWMAVGVSGGNMVFNTSSDGTTWAAVSVLSGLTLTDTPFKIVSTGNVVMLVQTNGVTRMSSDLGANWRAGPYFVEGPGMKAVAVATDPDGVACQLFVVGETAGGNTMYYMSHIGS